jgi:ABC-type branched-subunit amino acid transport system permease subunit
MPAGRWLAVAVPLAFLALLLARPAVDAIWENHQAHFWLVLAAAAMATALGYAVSAAARRRRDARLLLISFAFIASSGFLGLHALATPGSCSGRTPDSSSRLLSGSSSRVRSPQVPRPSSRGSGPSRWCAVPTSCSRSSSR